jgi:hypothetical protein
LCWFVESSCSCDHRSCFCVCLSGRPQQQRHFYRNWNLRCRLQPVRINSIRKFVLFVYSLHNQCFLAGCEYSCQHDICWSRLVLWLFVCCRNSRRCRSHANHLQLVCFKCDVCVQLLSPDTCCSPLHLLGVFVASWRHHHHHQSTPNISFWRVFVSCQRADCAH